MKEKNKIEYQISKSYSYKVSRDFQTWEFRTSLTKTIQVESVQELVQESTKLFEQVKGLTDLDICNHKDELPGGIPYVDK